MVVWYMLPSCCTGGWVAVSNELIVLAKAEHTGSTLGKRPSVFSPRSGAVAGSAFGNGALGQANAPASSGGRIRKVGPVRMRRASPWYSATGDRKEGQQVATRRDRLLRELVWAATMPVSDCDDVDVLGASSESFEILDVCRDHSAPRLGRGDHERIDCGTASGEPAEKRCTTGEGLGDDWRDIASLEEFVLDGVATRVALETLDENDGGRRLLQTAVS